MSKKNSLKFSVVRALAALGIALLLAFILIFVSAEGGSFGAKMSNSLAALQQMLLRPILKKSGQKKRSSGRRPRSGLSPSAAPIWSPIHHQPRKMSGSPVWLASDTTDLPAASALFSSSLPYGATTTLAFRQSRSGRSDP